jgi:hypothetical protein
MELLLKHKANVDVADKALQTPLLSTCEQGQFPSLEPTSALVVGLGRLSVTRALHLRDIAAAKATVFSAEPAACRKRPAKTRLSNAVKTQNRSMVIRLQLLRD